MGFFKKKKKEAKDTPQPAVEQRGLDLTAPADDPLGLDQPEVQEVPGPRDGERPRSGVGSGNVPHMEDDGAGVGTGPERRRPENIPESAGSGKAEGKSENGGTEGSHDSSESMRVMTNAARFLAGVALETRGLFEEVRGAEDAEAVRGFFRDSAAVPKSAILSGALDPHAAASLLVFSLRDAAEPLVTSELRPDILADAVLSDPAARFEALRDSIQLLPAANRAVLAALVELGVAVSHEHAACYQDGLETRMEGLAQLLGPLLTRPAPATFETDMAGGVAFASDLLKNPSLLSAPLRRRSSATDASSVTAPSQAPDPVPPPGVPSLSLPSRAAPTPRAVTFREGAGGPGGGTGGVGGAAEEGEDSDETNYNQVKTKTEEHAEFVRQVSALSDAQRKEYIQAALRGGPLLKYSSRGRDVALHFFKITEDMSSLKWAQATSPTDLKYGFPLHSAIQVCPGGMAEGSFHGAASDSHPELRLVLRLVGGLQLELEALNRPSLDVWAIALQHVLNARSSLPVALPFDAPPNPEAYMPYTHRDRALLPGSGPLERAGSAPYQVPGVRHGAVTSRLLDNAGRQSPYSGAGHDGTNAPGGGRARPSTARPSRDAPPAVGPRAPMTARGPGAHEELPDVTAINIQVMMSKARHNRHKELVALLDRGLPVDSTDAYGNTFLIVGCQNGHKRIVKEALRRYCNMDHRNRKGNTGLHFCFAYKYDELGRYLIEKGADDTVRNNRGKTCYEGLTKEELNDYADDPVDQDFVPPPNRPPPPVPQPAEAEAEAASKAEAEELERLRAAMRELEEENSLLRSQHEAAAAAAAAHSPKPDSPEDPAAHPSPAGPALSSSDTLSARQTPSPGAAAAPPRRGPPAAPKPIAGAGEAAGLEALGLVVSPAHVESQSTVQIGGRFERYSSSSAATSALGAGVGLFRQIADARPLEESGVYCQPRAQPAPPPPPQQQQPPPGLRAEAVEQIAAQHPPPAGAARRAPSVASTARSIEGLDNVLKDVKHDVEAAEGAAAQVLTPFAVDGASETEASPLTEKSVRRMAAKHPLPQDKYRAPSVASTARSLGGLAGVLDEVKHDVEAVEDVRWSVVGRMVDDVKHDVEAMEGAMALVTTPFAVDDAGIPDDVSVSSSIFKPSAAAHAPASPSPEAVADMLDISIRARSPCPPLMTPPLDASLASPYAPEKDRQLGATAGGEQSAEPVEAARDLVQQLTGNLNRAGGGVASDSKDRAQPGADGQREGGGDAPEGRKGKLAAIFGNLSGRGKYNPASAVGKIGEPGAAAGLPPKPKPAPRGRGGAAPGGAESSAGFSELEGGTAGRGAGVRDDAAAPAGVFSASSDSEEGGASEAQNESLEGLEVEVKAGEGAGEGGEGPSAMELVNALAATRVTVADKAGERAKWHNAEGRGRAPESSEVDAGDKEGGEDDGFEGAPAPPERGRKGGKGRVALRGESTERGKGLRVKAGTGSASKKMPLMSPAQRLKR